MLFRFLLKMYRVIFAWPIFYRFNKVVYRLSLSGMGILNFEDDRISGEYWFLQSTLKNRRNGVVIDVGANVGNYSKKVFEVNESLMVYAFEPHPLNYDKLVVNIQNPGFFPNQFAVGAASGVVDLYDYQFNDGSSHASLYKDVIEDIHQAQSTCHNVTIITLGDFLRNMQLQSITLLKIDVEGNELDVLRGMHDYITSGKVEVIHFEFNEMNVSSRSFFKDFWNLLPNYDFFRLLPNGMVPIKEYNPVLCEIFAFQNIIALLKQN